VTAYQGELQQNPARSRRESRIMLAHGGGGQLTDELIGGLVLPRLGNAALNELLDSGLIGDAAGTELALTIDSYVVQPLVFPGGDIGRLAVCGTVNDLAVCGAEPLGMALSLILTEGLEKARLEQVLDSVAQAAKEAGVSVITGDTKVVGCGQGDGMYITTAGVGRMLTVRRLHPDQVQAGDVIILSGSIADHGLAVMLAREMPDVQSVLKSDVAPLNRMIARLLRRVPQVVFMRDPTRGGLAAVAADLATRCGLRVVLDEVQIPVHPHTLHAAEMLGLDPLEVANEGKVVVVVRPPGAAAALESLQEDPLGREARIIGRVEESRDGLCEIRTTIGGRRILQKPYGEQLPRIC
jgi:hydrogenase expression/formation protein HypE